MKRIAIVLLLVGMPMVWLSAADIKVVETIYEYLSDNPNESRAQAEQTAIQRARFKAMEEKFGLDVSSVNSVVQRQKREGKETTSSSDLFAIRETAVRGEWIETLVEDILSVQYDNNKLLHVKVHVKGKARSQTKAKVDIKYALINNSHDRVNRDQYYDGDDLFLSFTSPRSGSLCVYLVDEENMANCLLPYQNATIGCQKVEANGQYLFFSKDYDLEADEYTLNTQRAQEQNVVYIVYTPNALTKASDRKAAKKNWRNEELPRQLTYEEFTSWLSKNQTRDEDMVVMTEVITIRR